MRRLALAVIAFTAVASPAAAADFRLPPPPPPPVPVVEAPPVGGFYVALRGSIAATGNTRFDFVLPTAADPQVKTRYEPGFAVSGAAGYSFNFGGPLAMRAEAEVLYTESTVDRHAINGRPFGGNSSFGRTSGFGAFASGYVDYDLGGFVPFFGVGVGFMDVAFNRHGALIANGDPILAGNLNGIAQSLLDQRSTHFAWHASIGFLWHLTPGIGIEGMYRFVQAPDITTVGVGQLRTSTDFNTHLLSLGLRFQL